MCHAYKEDNGRNDGSNFRGVVRRLFFEDACNTLDQTYNALTHDDECEELESFHKMRVFEAQYPPENCNEED